MVRDEKCDGREKSKGESFSTHTGNGHKAVSLNEIFLTNSCNMFHVLAQGSRQGGRIHKVKLRKFSMETIRTPVNRSVLQAWHNKQTRTTVLYTVTDSLTYSMEQSPS
jgi:hypothetical protein